MQQGAGILGLPALNPSSLFEPAREHEDSYDDRRGRGRAGRSYRDDYGHAHCCAQGSGGRPPSPSGILSSAAVLPHQPAQQDEPCHWPIAGLPGRVQGALLPAARSPHAPPPGGELWARAGSRHRSHTGSGACWAPCLASPQPPLHVLLASGPQASCPVPAMTHLALSCPTPASLSGAGHLPTNEQQLHGSRREAGEGCTGADTRWLPQGPGSRLCGMWTLGAPARLWDASQSLCFRHLIVCWHQ